MKRENEAGGAALLIRGQRVPRGLTRIFVSGPSRRPLSLYGGWQRVLRSHVSRYRIYGLRGLDR